MSGAYTASVCPTVAGVVVSGVLFWLVPVYPVALIGTYFVIVYGAHSSLNVNLPEAIIDLISVSMACSGGLLGIEIVDPGSHGLLFVFLLGVAVGMSIPCSVANSFTVCPALPPFIPCSFPILVQLRGLPAGQFFKVVSSFSVSHETFSKFGECFFCFGDLGRSSGEQKDCASLFL